jgi:hypothetical protein
MNVQDPLIDHRGYDDIVTQTEDLVKAELASVQLVWDPSSPDLASALIRIFSRMVQHVVDNLNQVPNQHFLSFLDLIGARRAPPRPARAALTFSIVKDADDDAIVPAGTQVASPPGEGETEEVLFETDRELVVSRALLTAVVVHRPDLDSYADRSPETPDGCPVLEADLTIEHSLFVDGGDLLALPVGTALTVEIGLPPDPLPPTWTSLLIAWTYWDGNVWQPLPGVISSVEGLGEERRQIAEFTLSVPIEPSLVNGQTGRWLRATLTSPLLAAEVDNVPVVDGIAIGAALTRSGLAADAAFAGRTSIDLSLDFRPFGEQPRIGDAFYLASAEVFSKGDAQVTLTITQSEAAVPAAERDDGDDPTLIWEVWTSSGWLEVGRSNRTDGNLKPLPLSEDDTPYDPDPSPYDFDDGTLALTQDGDVTFTLKDAAANVASLSYQGITSSWLRVRIAKGAQVYGSGVSFTTQIIQVAGPNDTTVDVPISVLSDNGYRPPVIASIALGYVHTPSRPVSAVLTLNDFDYDDHTDDNAGGFIPFTHLEGDGPSLYLGFDPAFSNRSASLFVEIAPPAPFAVAASALLDVPGGLTIAIFAWEYSAPSGAWTRLGVEDETEGFQRSGMVRFAGPVDLTRRPLFGKDLYWLRARLVEGTFTVSPLLRCIKTNTVAAFQATTITDEVLGSSIGSPDQAFSLAQTPVLSGQRIQVLEPAAPQETERAALVLAGGADAIVPAFDEGGDSVGVWVTWSEASDFHTSDSRDRHYTLNHMTGQILFGDGVRGLVPPSGAGNVRASFYRAGGGSRGNRAIGTITGLKTTVANVAGVTNTVPSVGGTDMGSVAEQKELGPRTLRHGHYAICSEDFEDMAREASTDVVRARAVTPHFDPVAQTSPAASLPAGSVLLIVVPSGAGARPIPPPALIEDVRRYIEARCPPAVSLRVSGPDWVRVTAQVTLVASSPEASDEIVAEARAALQRYLHPLTGGPEGRGWDFGAVPHTSDLYPMLGRLAGVDHIRRLTLAYEVESAPDTWVTFSESTPPDVLHRVLIFSGSHAIDIYAGTGG